VLKEIDQQASDSDPDMQDALEEVPQDEEPEEGNGNA
jgi:hypothetical protein